VKRSDLGTVDVLRLIAGKPENFREWTSDYLARQLPDVPPKVILAKLDQLDGMGLIDCGVSIRGCWLTRAGRQMLAAEGQTEQRGETA